MIQVSNEINTKQEFFKEMVLGTLVYSVVLGFFNDYTNILQTKSFSVTFGVAIVMQILTYGTFLLKDVVVKHFKNNTSKYSKAGLVFGVWLIMFFSKFVFLAVIEFIFSNDVKISGFFGLLAIVLTMTIAKQIVDYIYNALAD